MGQALLAGLIGTFADPTDLAVIEPDSTTRDRISDEHPGVVVSDTAIAGVPTVLAVKPFLAVEVAEALPEVPRLLSVCAGVTTAALQKVSNASVVRCMPNTPALQRMGAAGVAIGSSADEDDLRWGLEILGAVGIALPVTEDQLDAVTGLSGSGPAYVFLIAEAMTDAGVACGLPRRIAEQLAYQTIAGAGAMLNADGADATRLRADVTTPAGTTSAGLGQLEAHGVRAAFDAAITAATRRSRELGAET
jgi:pyrroline-5-carboxylate reductase